MGIDQRGLRFGALITTVVLAVVVVRSFNARTASAAWLAISRIVIMLATSLTSSRPAPDPFRASAADSASTAEP